MTITCARFVSFPPLKSIETLYTTPKFGCIFRPQFIPDTVGRRSLPSAWGASREGARRRRKFFQKKNQNERFSLRNVLFSLFLPLYFGWKFGYFMKNIKIYQNLKNFRKFLKIFENFLIKKFFEKKFFFFDEKNWKNVKKKFLKT